MTAASGGCPRAPDYYAYGLRYATTTRMSAGRDPPARPRPDGGAHRAAPTTILRAQGMTQGSVAARLGALGRDPRHIYPNTDAGKEQLLADLNAQMAAIRRRLPDYFGRLPRATCEIRRVPPAIEAGAPGGYYQSPALDGSRPGAYYINLRDTAEWPKWTLPTLTYHEAVPGHHHQIALAQEATGIPPAPPPAALFGLYRRLGPLCRGAGRRDGRLRERPARQARLSAELHVPRRALRRRHRPPPQALEPRAGDPLHGRDARRPGKLGRDRGRALLRLAGPGDQLQGRPDPLEPAARARPAASSATASTSRASTTPRSPPARCRSRCWSG